MADSVQHKIGRNRPPRVQITYDVEIGDAIEKAEIPFVVGIMADLSGLAGLPGKGDKPRPDGLLLKDKNRPFVEIDRDNFTDVMAKIAPVLKVTGALDDEAAGKLIFRSLDDFNPKALVDRIRDLKDLQERRNALRDILTKIGSNEVLYNELMKRVKAGLFTGPASAAQAKLTELRKLKTAQSEDRDADPADGKAGGDKPADVKAGGDKPADVKAGGDKPADDKAGGDKPADDKAGDDKPADDKPADDKPADDKPADGKSA